MGAEAAGTVEAAAPGRQGRLCTVASKGGHLDCLKYVHEQGCEWDADTCEAAARGGHLECLKYAHEQGCEWDADTCHSAAIGGHLGVLEVCARAGL